MNMYARSLTFLFCVYPLTMTFQLSTGMFMTSLGCLHVGVDIEHAEFIRAVKFFYPTCFSGSHPGPLSP